MSTARALVLLIATGTMLTACADSGGVAPQAAVERPMSQPLHSVQQAPQRTVEEQQLMSRIIGHYKGRDAEQMATLLNAPQAIEIRTTNEALKPLWVCPVVS